MSRSISLLFIGLLALALAACTPGPAGGGAPTPAPATDLPASPTGGPQITETPAVEPTAAPTEPTVEPTPAGPAVPLPGMTADLLFLSGGYLVRWEQPSGAFIVIAGPDTTLPPAATATPGPPPVEGTPAAVPGTITHYAVDAEGRVVVFARLKAPGVIELVRRELAATDETILAEFETPRVLFLELAPSGQWVATVPADPGLGEYDPPTGDLHVLATDPSGARLTPVKCGASSDPNYSLGCGVAVWSPDSSLLAWNDAAGVWLRSIEQPEPRLLVENSLAQPGAPANEGAHLPQAFSPDGRFLTMRVIYYEGAAQAVLRIEDGRIELIPGSDEYQERSMITVWVDSEFLLAARRGSDYPDVVEPALEIFQVAPSGDGLLASVLVTPLADAGVLFPAELARLAGGRVAFVMLGSRLSNTGLGPGGLYLAEPPDYAPVQVNTLPAMTEGGGNYDWIGELVMAPDGSTLVRYNQAVLYVPAGGGEPLDVRPDLGDGPQQFLWLPE